MFANQEPPLGKVVLEFYVDAKGKPQDIKVVESNDPRYTEAAVKSAKNWTLDEKYRNQRKTVPVLFSVPPDKIAPDASEKKRANKAPEPTPPSVTSPAAAGAAPAGVVAHL